MMRGMNPPQPTDDSPVESPCNHDCVLNADNLCLGCFRTINEITDWAQKPQSEQLEILERCRQRVAQYRKAGGD